MSRKMKPKVVKISDNYFNTRFVKQRRCFRVQVSKTPIKYLQLVGDYDISSAEELEAMTERNRNYYQNYDEEYCQWKLDKYLIAMAEEKIEKDKHQKELDSLNTRKLVHKFYNNKLTPLDLENVEVRVLIVSPRYVSSHIEHYGVIWHNGATRGSLRPKAKNLFKDKEGDFLCDVLIIKYGSKLWDSFFDAGFYKFNPHMKTPNSILTYKLHQES